MQKSEIDLERHAGIVQTKAYQICTSEGLPLGTLQASIVDTLLVWLLVLAPWLGPGVARPGLCRSGQPHALLGQGSFQCGFEMLHGSDTPCRNSEPR